MIDGVNNSPRVYLIGMHCYCTLLCSHKEKVPKESVAQKPTARSICSSIPRTYLLKKLSFFAVCTTTHARVSTLNPLTLTVFLPHFSTIQIIYFALSIFLKSSVCCFLKICVITQCTGRNDLNCTVSRTKQPSSLVSFNTKSIAIWTTPITVADIAMCFGLCTKMVAE